MGVVKTFLLPSYGFSFGYNRKGVSIAPLTEARRNIVGQKMRVNAFPCRRYNPSVFSACKPSRKSSSPCTGEPRFALRLARGAQGAAAYSARALPRRARFPFAGAGVLSAQGKRFAKYKISLSLTAKIVKGKRRFSSFSRFKR